MQKSKIYKRYTVTSALPYANGPIHIGQLAGAYLPADIYVRYLRSKGEDVVYICGSDEHGVPITLRAKKEGVSPQKIVDQYHEMNKNDFAEFGISFDIFHRTSSKLHHETASEFFKKMYDDGQFEARETEQYYDEENQQFLADRYIVGTCPNCSYDSAYGDQCENCGTSLSPKELINPRSAISGNPPILKKTKHWYLPLDKYQENWLDEWITGHKGDWKPNVYGQCRSWLDQGLKQRAVTRDLDWGVKVPIEEAKGKVLYVWFDAPIGYISATRQWAKDNKKDWELYWKDEETRLLHFIGKDNIVFHCIIFPAMLKEEGSYILPDNVPANEFLNLEGDKISTSRDRAVWLKDFLKDFPGKQDVMRYCLTANMPETKDNDFSWKDFQAKNNNELVAILGNFVNRVFVLAHKYFEGDCIVEDKKFFDESFDDLNSVNENISKMADSLENFKFRKALAEMINVARIGNLYLAQTEPWKLIESNPDEVKKILSNCIQIIANLSILTEPLLPNTSAKLASMVGLSETDINWKNTGNAQLIKPGQVIKKAELLFEKIEDDVIDREIEKLNKSMEEKSNGTQKASINYDEFSKMDMIVGTIVAAEKVEKADKLLQLSIDIGSGTRTVVSGIAENYDPKAIIGQQVSLLANLEPRKIRGIESQGMILMAENEKGELVFLTPSEKFENGSKIT